MPHFGSLDMSSCLSHTVLRETCESAGRTDRFLSLEAEIKNKHLTRVSILYCNMLFRLHLVRLCFSFCRSPRLCLSWAGQAIGFKASFIRQARWPLHAGPQICSAHALTHESEPYTQCYGWGSDHVLHQHHVDVDRGLPLHGFTCGQTHSMGCPLGLLQQRRFCLDVTHSAECFLIHTLLHWIPRICRKSYLLASAQTSRGAETELSRLFLSFFGLGRPSSGFVGCLLSRRLSLLLLLA